MRTIRLRRRVRGHGQVHPDTMSLHEPVPNPPSQRDTSAVVGILVELVGELHREHYRSTDEVGEEVDRLSLADQLRWRLEYVGLLPPEADSAQLALALENLSQRMRYALGEYEVARRPTSVSPTMTFGSGPRRRETRSSATWERQGYGADPPDVAFGPGRSSPPRNSLPATSTTDESNKSRMRRDGMEASMTDPAGRGPQIRKRDSRLPRRSVELAAGPTHPTSPLLVRPRVGHKVHPPLGPNGRCP